MIYTLISSIVVTVCTLSASQDNNTAVFETNNKFALESHRSCSLSTYESLEANGFSKPAFHAFDLAFEGYDKLLSEGLIQNQLLTVIDFSLSSSQKRLWVIDMTDFKVVVHTYVAHGRNSGEEFATQFSNVSESFQSSLGFYTTSETYHGKHGYSLRLDGLQKGVNDMARSRAIVIHAADYVSEEFIKNQGRLGRSHGCPALSPEDNDKVINLIKDKSCLFIYHPTFNKDLSLKVIV